MLLFASFFLYLSSEVRGFKRVLSPQLAPVVVSFSIDVIAIFIGLTAGFVAMFGRVNLLPVEFPLGVQLEFNKQPIYKLEHLDNTIDLHLTTQTTPHD
jgi:hypothetical protein